jgi:hypothetical protein
MNPLRWSLAALLVLAPAVWGQQYGPHIGYVYPAGGRQGTTFEVTVGGQFLDGASEAFLTGAGIQAAVLEYVKPMSQGQFNQLREKLQELLTRKTAATKKQRKGGAAEEVQSAPKPVWTAEDEKAVDELRKKLATFVRRPASPAIAETVRLKITLAADAAPGDRELRLETRGGLTNPMMFRIGQLPEFSKAPAKLHDESTTGKGARYRSYATDNKPTGPVEITLPTIVNGQIQAGTVDRYSFRASKGQHIVVAAGARELIPYISDAVPGWFQATLGLYDAKGKELEYAGNFRFHPDPVLYYEIAGDGEYTLEIKDSIYRGREDFVYRITIGELPFITSIFPLGGKLGAKSAVELKGWNLPAARLTRDSKESAIGVHPVSVRKGEWSSNNVPFAVDSLPELMEKEPNNSKDRAQRVKLPVIVNGRVNQPGDADVFRFEGRAGEEIVAEVLARRLDSPLDSILRLTDATGKELAVNDDHEDKGAGLLTHHADSMIQVKLPANGTYYLSLNDSQKKGGPEYAYRLRISQPRPDFELRVVPASITARAGMTVPVTVFAMRRDGFTAEIALKLKDAPAGFKLSGGWIPANQNKIRLTLTVPTSERDVPLNLHLEGQATIQGREVRRPGIPAEDMMQAFYYYHLVPAKEWRVMVAKGGRFKTPWKLAAEKTVKLPAGGTAPVRISLLKGSYSNQIAFDLNNPPEGIGIAKIVREQGGIAVLLRADPAKVKPGFQGNLILNAFVERSANSASTKKNAPKRQDLGVLPAIPFEIVSTLEARK